MPRPSRRSLLSGVFIAIAVAAVVLVVHPFAAAAPRLVWGGATVAEGWKDTAVGIPISYGGMDPCVSSGSVTVTNITFTRSSGLVATGWGSRPNPFEHGGHQLGGEKTTVEAAGFQVGPRHLTDLCSVMTSTSNPALNDFEFAIEFHRTGPATGWSYGVTVTYRSGGRSHTSRWPLSYVLCGNTTPAYPTQAMNRLCDQV